MKNLLNKNILKEIVADIHADRIISELEENHKVDAGYYGKLHSIEFSRKKDSDISKMYKKFGNKSIYSEFGYIDVFSDKFWISNYNKQSSKGYSLYRIEHNYVSERELPTLIEDSCYNPFDNKCILNETKPASSIGRLRTYLLMR